MKTACKELGLVSLALEAGREGEASQRIASRPFWGPGLQQIVDIVSEAGARKVPHQQLATALLLLNLT